MKRCSVRSLSEITFYSDHLSSLTQKRISQTDFLVLCSLVLGLLSQAWIDGVVVSLLDLGSHQSPRQRERETNPKAGGLKYC